MKYAHLHQIANPADAVNGDSGRRVRRGRSGAEKRRIILAFSEARSCALPASGAAFLRASEQDALVESPDDSATDGPRGHHGLVASVELSPDGLEPDGLAPVRVGSVPYGRVKTRGGGAAEQGDLAPDDSAGVPDGRAQVQA